MTGVQLSCISQQTVIVLFSKDRQRLRLGDWMKKSYLYCVVRAVQWLVKCCAKQVSWLICSACFLSKLMF